MARLGRILYNFFSQFFLAYVITSVLKPKYAHVSLKNELKLFVIFLNFIFEYNRKVSHAVY